MARSGQRASFRFGQEHRPFLSVKELHYLTRSRLSLFDISAASNALFVSAARVHEETDDADHVGFTVSARRSLVPLELLCGRSLMLLASNGWSRAQRLNQSASMSLDCQRLTAKSTLSLDPLPHARRPDPQRLLDSLTERLHSQPSGLRPVPECQRSGASRPAPARAAGRAGRDEGAPLGDEGAECTAGVTQEPTSLTSSPVGARPRHGSAAMTGRPRLWVPSRTGHPACAPPSGSCSGAHSQWCLPGGRS